MQPWKLSELQDVLDCVVPGDAEITAVSTDTRDLPKGCLFVALRGAHFDGHDFVAKAIGCGAVAAVTDHPIPGCPCLVVKNTARAFLQIAAFYRKKFRIFLTAVTGSVGKTTTKEMISCVLESQFDTLKTQGNLNNEIGLPKTLLQLESHHEAAVVEMGMSDFGEIHRLSTTAAPTVAVMTNIGYSHIEYLKTQAGILKAKLEILDGMAPESPLIVNGDDPYLNPLKAELRRPVISYAIDDHTADVYADDIFRGESTTSFRIYTPESSYPVFLPCMGDHNIRNALAAFCVGRLAGIEPEKICTALENYKTVGSRQNIVTRNGMTILDDCYNASPDSMRAALSVLQEIPCKGRRVAVLGDMLELGEMSEQLHAYVGELAAQNNVDALFCYGKDSLYLAKRAAEKGLRHVLHTENKEELCASLRAFLREGDAVLWKASRGMHLEDCLAAVLDEKEA